MRASSASTTAAALLASASLVSAAGKAIVQNQCSQDLYLWSVASSSSKMFTLPANGGSYSETYRTNSDGGGVSIKIAKSNDQSGGITQFEYTLGDTLWYDVSNINGYPFMSSGLSVVPSSTSCSTITCPAGVENCSEVYNVPTDNFAVAACSPNSNMVITLCATGSSASSAASKVATSTSAAGIDFTPLASILNIGAAVTSAAPQVTQAPAAAPAAASGPQLLQWSDVVNVAEVATPVVSTANVNNNVDVVTTLITQYVTIDARNAEPTAAPEPVEQSARKERRHAHHRHQAREYQA